MTAFRQLVPRPIRRAASVWLARGNSNRLQRELTELASGRDPIVAGPWMGEVGFELLYWVPFLAWFAERFNVSPDRLLVISRGGTACWYKPFAAHYADIFDQVTPERFRQLHDARVRDIGEQKQTRSTDLEHELIETAAFRNNFTRWSVLHPARMYNLLNPFWWGHLSLDWVHLHTRYRRLPTPDGAGVAGIPSSPYIAVKFYYNDCFTASDQNRAFVREVLRKVSAYGPVVWLSTGLIIDDHLGVRLDEQGLHHLPEGTDPARNLQVQSAIVAKARAFVGTYGGFAYLAPFHGVPSIVFYDNPKGFSPKHLGMARSAFERIGSAGLLRACAAVNGVDPLSEVGAQGT